MSWLLRYLAIACLFLCPMAGLMANAQKTLCIVTYNVAGAKPWDPDSIHSGITGSEEAVIYMSQELAKLGYRVIVANQAPADSRHTHPDANPHYGAYTLKENEQFDIAILWRSPNDAPLIKAAAKKIYFWPHDICDRVYPKEVVDSLDGVLWLSQWQYEQWSALSPSFKVHTSIYGNGIMPNQFKPVTARKNPYACIYGSNYGRGLELLLDIWPTIHQRFPKATLDIYYGWQHWGLLTAEKEVKLRKLVDDYKELGVTDHGLVSHEKLNEAYAKASFWTYPCTAEETFCITALRAQLSGTIPVIIESCALKETVRHGYKCTDPKVYANMLIHAMEHADEISLAQRKEMGSFVLKEYTWSSLAQKWKKTFDAAESSDRK